MKQRRDLFLRNIDLLARYNRDFNHRLHAVLGSAEFDRAALFGQMNHLLAMDAIWLSRLGCASWAPPSMLTRYSTPAGNLHQWWDRRVELDAALTGYVALLEMPDLEEAIDFVTEADNAAVRCSRWAALTHVFNHQTLHRGEMVRLLNIDRVHFGNSDLLPHIVEILPETAMAAALS